MKGYFYIIQFNDGNYYYGSTSDLNERFEYHQSGRVRSTRHHLPLKLVYQEEYPTYKQANRREYEVKSWKSRARVEKLINGAIV